MIAAPYRFFYRIEDKVDWIVAVGHGTQLPEEPSPREREEIGTAGRRGSPPQTLHANVRVILWRSRGTERVMLDQGSVSAPPILRSGPRTYSREAYLGNSMARRLISSGSTFEEQIGYSRAVVDGDWVFVSGTTGFDYSTMSISEGLLEQTEQCLRNIESALRRAGASLQDVVRVTYVLPTAGEFERCWPVLRKYFGDVRPAATMISAGLADPRIKIEIEVTARRRARKPLPARGRAKRAARPKGRR